MLHCARLERAAPKASAAPGEQTRSLRTDLQVGSLDRPRPAGAHPMTSGIFEIEGVEYPDADASDPVASGWMQGSPPPPAKQIRFQDDRFLEFPQIRWTLSHMRELAPTANVWRGKTAPSDLGAAPQGREAAIEALEFEDLRGRPLTWAQSLRETYTDGIVVLHRGRRVYERYFGALEEQRPHACFSITKSYAATLAATLIHERALDETKNVSHYLPEMAGTAYEDATLRQVLDMQIGVQYSELYSDPKAHIWDYGRAGGLRPRTPDRTISTTICAHCVRKGLTAPHLPIRQSTRKCSAGS